jgi:hypothetical protein
MHHSRERYRDEILSQFDAGHEFVYQFTERTSLDGFDSQTRFAR